MLAAVPRAPPTGAAASYLPVVGTGRRSTSRAAARQVAAAATASRPAAATAPAASGSSTERPQAPASTDLSCLTDEELQQTLALRRLSEAGGRQKQERRLAAFLADPSAFPSAACRPTVTAAVLAGRLFAGQLQLRSHIQLLLQLLRSEPEVAPGHPDFAFLLALLQRHPRYSQKVTPPVAAFRVREVHDPMGDLAPFKCFEFRDARGTWEDFSYRKCIDFNPAYSEVLAFRDAMRFGVQDQLQAYRLACAEKVKGRNQRVWKCSCCQRLVNSTRIEYAGPTFGALVRGFCETTTLQPPPIDGRAPDSKRGCFTDEAWLTEWRRYHRRHARQLRLTCMRCIKIREAELQAAAQAKKKAAEAAAASRKAALLQIEAAARGAPS